MNYALVTQHYSCEQDKTTAKETKELDEVLDVYFSEPDVFKQYYIENNYGSLSDVTSSLFADPVRMF